MGLGDSILSSGNLLVRVFFKKGTFGRAKMNFERVCSDLFQASFWLEKKGAGKSEVHFIVVKSVKFRKNGISKYQFLKSVSLISAKSSQKALCRSHENIEARKDSSVREIKIKSLRERFEIVGGRTEREMRAF